MKKKSLFISFLLTACVVVQAQKKGEVTHPVTCIIHDFMSLSLQTNSSDVSQQKQLVINSNFPFNIVVDEKYEGPSFSYAPNFFNPDEVAHGPAVSQLTSIKKLRYFRYIEEYKYITLLYTAAQF